MTPALQYLRLLALAWRLSHNAQASVDVVRDAVEASDDAFTQRWLVSWSWHESRWGVDAVDPTGATFGCLQIDASTWGRAPLERAAQFEQGVEVLAILEWTCGTRRRALNSYATGKCELASDLVTARCAEIGGCE